MTGIIVVDKHEDISSFWAAAQVRRITGEKKVGHTGTLDPMASGILPVMLGGATKFCELLPSHEKSYRATILLGTTTDTLDVTGTVITSCEVNSGKAEFESALDGFRGNIRQLPPMYSAVFKDGVRLYKLARQGIEVEREERSVTISSLSLVSADESANEYTIDVCCSAGTYIRTLASDIGAVLGCGAVLKSLRRTAANGFTADNAFTIAKLEELALSGELEPALLPIDSAMKQYPELTITDSQSVRFKNGGALDAARLKKQLPVGLVRVYSPSGEFLGLGEMKPNADELSVRRLLIK